MMWSIELISLLTTISLAAVGYLVTYFNDKRIHRREEELKLVNERLEKLFGPLYFSTIAGETAYKTLLRRLGRDQVDDNPTEEELAEWRNWVANIFIPLNRKQQDIIYNFAYLIPNQKHPKCFVTFVQHVSETEAILNKWNAQDYSEHFPVIDYPEDMGEYVHKTYFELKKQQGQLIGKK